MCKSVSHLKPETTFLSIKSSGHFIFTSLNSLADHMRSYEISLNIPQILFFSQKKKQLFNLFF